MRVLEAAPSESMEPDAMILRSLAVFLALLLAAPRAQAVIFEVDAALHYAAGGVGVVTTGVTAGEALRVLPDPAGQWQASEALGATGLDGAPGSTFMFAGLTAPRGALVGEIAGIYRVLGASFDGEAWASGTLRLFHWDGDALGNAGRVFVRVEPGEGLASPGVIETAVPLPAALGVLAAALLVLAVARRAG
jgi:hypothetical protein